MALYYLIFIVFYAVFGAIYSNTIVFLRAFDVLVSAKAHKLRLLLKRAIQKPRIYRICCWRRWPLRTHFSSQKHKNLIIYNDFVKGFSQNIVFLKSIWVENGSTIILGTMSKRKRTNTIKYNVLSLPNAHTTVFYNVFAIPNFLFLWKMLKPSQNSGRYFYDLLIDFGSIWVQIGAKMEPKSTTKSEKTRRILYILFEKLLPPLN
jgi:hypothetical protein